MTATADIPQTTEPAVKAVEIRMIPLNLLEEARDNPRQIYPEREMQELTESMRLSGFRLSSPLTVRPMGNMFFEIAAGHRRKRAAEEAGLTEVPCIVQELSDEQFLDLLNFENSGRQDVHPLHEAEGWHKWMERFDKGVLDIAAKIGKSKEYVYQGLKYSELIPEVKKAFLNGDITSGHAILIARLQPDDQESALEFTLNPDYTGVKASVRKLADYIRKDIHLEMAGAAFDLDSVDLVPAAGSCNACPKRTRNSPELMLAVEYAANPNSDECMDPGCFHSKVEAHLVQIQALHQKQGVTLLKISSSQLAKKGADYGRANFEQISEVPGDNLQPGIWMDGPKIGGLVYVRLVQPSQYKDNVPVRPSAPAPSDNRASEGLEKQRRLENQRLVDLQIKADEAREREESKQKAKAALELAVRRQILDTISAKVGSLSRVDVEVLLCDYLHNAEISDEFIRVFGEQFEKPMPRAGLDKLISQLGDADVYKMAVLIPLFDELDLFQLDRRPEMLQAAAKRYKVDAQKIRIQVETAAKKPAAPVPAADTKPPVDQKKMVVPPAKKKAAAKKKAPAAKPAAAKKANGKK